MSEELVTVPPDGVPCVLTLIGPEAGDAAGQLVSSQGHSPPKITAGPYTALAPSLSVAVTAELDPLLGSVTEGAKLLELAVI
jgi:hypothetical protein